MSVHHHAEPLFVLPPTGHRHIRAAAELLQQSGHLDAGEILGRLPVSKYELHLRLKDLKMELVLPRSA